MTVAEAGATSKDQGMLAGEEADCWFEYLEATRGQEGQRYQELELWAWARLDQRLKRLAWRKRRGLRGGREHT